ncbi:glycosyltransferase family 1 protein [Olivibacter sp. CPCC 100613]|uniref:glycosyltransferase family 4 protein n=1 Tax=Olivibacter sp. CPCC 100613 TaxID=3079931 RepID=UPI002FFB3DA7
MKKKIYVNGKFLAHRVTGVHRYAIEIVKKLIEFGEDVEILVPPHMPFASNPFPEVLIKEVRGYKSRLLWEHFSLPAYLKKQKNYVLLSLCNIGTLYDKNQILCIHDMSYAVNPSWFTKSFARYYRIMIPRLAKRAKRLITVSEFSKRQITEQLGIKYEDVSVVYNAPADKFNAVSTSNISYSKDDFFLFVGSMDPRKNINLIIDFFSKPEQSHQKLVIVGAKIKSFNEVNFQIPSNVKVLDNCNDDELAALYRRAKAMINPSFYEGFGIPVVEAMASGCPLILSNLEVYREIAEEGAFYFDPYSTESLSAAVERFQHTQEDEMHKLIDENITRSKDFSWEKSSYALLNVINQA